jgi:hypothetical protein
LLKHFSRLIHEDGGEDRRVRMGKRNLLTGTMTVVEAREHRKQLHKNYRLIKKRPGSISVTITVPIRSRAVPQLVNWGFIDNEKPRKCHGVQ